MASTLTKTLPAMTDPRPKSRVVGSAFSFADHAWTFSFQAADLHQEIVTLDTTTVSGVVEWLSNDPIGISGGLNQYVFCNNNPVNFTDPFGLCTSGKGKAWQDYEDMKAIGFLDTVKLVLGIEAPTNDAEEFLTILAGPMLGGMGGQGKAKVLQTGGHTLQKATLEALGLSKEQGKRAIEALKKMNGLGNDAHGQILSDGSVLDAAGNVVDNIFGYVP